MPVPVSAGSSATLPLHRIRFYDQTPSPITCLAFPPLPLPPARDPSHKGKNKDDGTGIGSGTIKQDQRRPDELGVLVVARENGNIELHQWGRENGDAFGNWTCVKVLPPTLTHPSVSLMTLVIRDPDHFHTKPYCVPKVEDLRLFTAGSDSTDLVERCLLTGRILSTYPIPSPPLWSIAVSPTHQQLCLATSSPSLHFLSVPAHGGPLEPPPPHLLRSEGLPSRSRTVSLAWGVPRAIKSDDSESGWEWRDTYVITGNSDSSFRKYEIPQPPSGSSGGAAQGRVTIKSRAVVEKIGKVKGKKVNKGTIVWGVAVLPDHTIVTSDSLGSVTFWDGASMAQKQTFNAHKADGMCLVVGPSGNTVFTSGPDQRVCQFTYVPSSRQWAQTSTKRLHSHDVRALAIFPAYTPITPRGTASQADLAPVLASGGWDMSLTLTPAASPSLQSEKLRNPLGKAFGMSRCVFEEAFTRKLGYLGSERISISRGARLVVGRKDRSVGVWRVLPDEEGWEKVLEMDFRLRTNLISSAVSHDGQFLAVSDLYETKLFHLVPNSDSQAEAEGALRAVRIKSFLPTLASSPVTAHLGIESRGLGSSTLHFTPDSRRLIMGHVPSGNVIVIQLPQLAQQQRGVEVIKAFRPAGNVVGGRVIAGNGVANANGHAKRSALSNGNGDVDMNGDEDEKEDDDGEEDDDEEQGSDEEPEGTRGQADGDGTWISCLAASDDGQWLASSDTRGCVTVYNLDTLQVHATLPTLPVPPTQLLFPSSSPSLMLILTPSGLSAYHIERRRLLPPTATTQLAEINTALAGQYLPAHAASMDQHRLIVWAHDYLLTARLDLSSADPNATAVSLSASGSKRERKKRAREAREALERSTSLSLSVDSPAASASHDTSEHVQGAGVKVHGSDTFKSIVGVGWIGEGEMAVVERPTSDFIGELPPVFSVASYGRS